MQVFWVHIQTNLEMTNEQEFDILFEKIVYEIVHEIVHEIDQKNVQKIVPEIPLEIVPHLSLKLSPASLRTKPGRHFLNLKSQYSHWNSV